MGIFSKKELTWDEVLTFLKDHKSEIDNVLAEELMKIIVKTNTNDILFYRVNDANV